MSFKALGLSDCLVKEIINQGYTEPYPVQMEAIPSILSKKDVLVSAQTGAGKTASFILPILEIFQRKTEKRSLHLKVLILVPTRELALQIFEVTEAFSNNLPHKVKHNVVYGGVSLNSQMITLKNTEILIATPGRLLELVTTQSINLSKIEICVIDEADKMLDVGFSEELDQIIDLLPKKKQNILFSATLDFEGSLFKKLKLENPVQINIAAEPENLDLIRQTAYRTTSERKGPLLRYIIKSQNLEQVLVFVSSVRTADNLVEKLLKNGINAAAIHSKKTQSARIEALAKFKVKNLRVLVATDLASRGIDIHLLPIVINFELPRSPKDYIHRIGRTGRAGETGSAISLVCADDEHHFRIIQKKSGKRVELLESSEFDLHGI